MLNIYFPFDPCLLKVSANTIKPLYLSYEDCNSNIAENLETLKRKRLESCHEDCEEDIDDFFFEDKKIKNDMDCKFSYNSYPGFHK